MERIRLAQSTLDKLRVPHSFDDASASITAATAACASDKQAVVLTSASALRAYDPVHPERIACIVVKSSIDCIDFVVIVRDRELDVENFVTHWWKRDPIDLRSAECVVCFKSTGRYVKCPHCDALVCLKCNARLEHDDVSRCTVCRTWKLVGSAHGVPWTAAPVPVAELVGPSPVDRLVDMLLRLDGKITLIPRVNSAFLLDDSVSMTRLAFTDRYAPDSLRAKHVRARLHKLVKRHAACLELRFYVLRRTFRIDKTAYKPVTELAVFYVTDDDLLACGNAAYINVFNTNDMPDVHIVKTEYVEPFRPLIPAHVSQLQAELHAEFPCMKTVSIVSVRHGAALGMNFDVDADGEITTMHPDMAAMRVHVLLTCDDAAHVTCRVFRHGDLNHADFVAYRLDRHGYARLPPTQAMKLHSTDVDGLRKSKIIRAFL